MNKTIGAPAATYVVPHLSHLEVLEIPGLDTTLRMTAEVSKRCPFRNEVDSGTVTVYCPRLVDRTVELHSVAKWFELWRDTAISHEMFTMLVHAAFCDVLRVQDVQVTSNFDTAGIRVEIVAF